MTSRILPCFAALWIGTAATFAQTQESAPFVQSPALDPAISSVLVGAESMPTTDRIFWLNADYMYARVQSSKLPPLITTSAVDGIDRANAGILGDSATRIVYGGPINDRPRSGFRVGAGWWFYPEAGWGLEAGFTMIESQSSLFSVASDGSVVLARPYFDANTGLAQAVLVAFPDSSSGSIGIKTTSDNFYGFNLDLMQRAYDAGWVRLNTLLGYRFYNYNESVTIQQNLFPTDPNFVPGTAIISIDNFGTRNHFHGLDLGLRTEFVWDSLSLEVLTKVAFGRLHTAASVSGQQVTSVPGVDSVVANAGVFALQSNIGNYSDYRLAAMPEFGATLKWQVASNLQIRLGYSLLLLNDVMRAADQIDTTIDPSNFPAAATTGGNRPSFQFRRADVWIQSISGGLSFTF